MTREEKLYSMTMKALVEEAEKIGVKIDKKGSKQKAVEKMLAAEAKMAEVAETAEEEKCSDGTEYAEVMQEITAGAEKKAEEAKTKKKERKARRTKKTFEQLVAEIPVSGNVRMIRAANGDVLVKRGNQRIFRYNGHCMIATSEKMFTGCEYEKQNWNGYVIYNATPETMKRVFKNA